MLASGVNSATLSATAATTLNRDISSIGTGINYISTIASGYTFTLNGNVSLTNSLYIYGEANAAAVRSPSTATSAAPAALLTPH